MTQASFLSARPPLAPTDRNILAVASGKGGVGKTWLSITLAHALARLGRKVLLFDGDLGLANVDVQLGLASVKDLGGVLAGRYDLRDAASDYALGGFQVIAGRSGSGTLAAIPEARLRHLADELVQLSTSYDSVILDLGAGIDRTVRHLASLAATCLVVTTDEPTALTDAYAFIKLAVLQNRESDLRVVVNLASSTGEANRTYTTLRKACENFLKVSPPLAGIVCRDGKVKEAIRAQTSLLTRYPNAPAANDVEALAGHLLS